MNSTETDKQAIKQRLNQETAKVSWHELQPHFARGAILQVAAELDLLEVAAEMSLDNGERVQQWMQRNQLRRVDDQQAADWYRLNPELWTCVVAPWILVQWHKQ